MTDHPDIRARAIALYDRFTHEHHDRRAFMAEMTRLAGSVAAAELLVATIAANPAAAAVVPPDDKRLDASRVNWNTAPGRQMKGYRVHLRGVEPDRPAVIVIHENRGLNAYVEDVARRLALAGFLAIAPDFLSPQGGTPADEDKARQMIGALDIPRTVADGVATIGIAARTKGSNGKVGVVGFCWGGAMANRLAVAAGPALKAAVAFYGPPPPPAEATKVKAEMMLHYAGLDDRVNAGAGPWVAALKAAGVKVTRFDYAGAQHAFHNDTSAARYNAAAANLAWDRTIDFFKRTLK